MFEQHPDMALGLYTELLDVLGSALTGLWIGEDMVIDVDGNVTLRPGRVGGNASISGGTNYRIKSLLNGRMASVTTDTSVYRGYLTPAIDAKTVISVAEIVQVPFDTYRTLVRGTTTLMVVGLSTTNRLHAGNDGLMTFMIDGVPGPDVTVGNHIIAAFHPTSKTETYSLDYNKTAEAARNWSGKEALHLFSNITPSAEQMLLLNQILSSYYSIPIAS